MSSDTRSSPARAPEDAAPAPLPRGFRPSTRLQFQALSLAMLRGYVRDRSALFFTFLFPLMFLVVFGLLFRSDDANRTELGVVGSGPVISALPDEVVEATPYETPEEAVSAVEDGDVAAAVVEDGDDVTLYFSATSQVQAGTARGLVSAAVDAVNLEATGQPPVVTLTSEQVESEEFQAIQFITPGILSWAVATSATFGAGLTLVAWRKRQVLRRIRLSPAPVWTVVAARVGVSLAVAVGQAVLFVGIALTPPFGLQLAGSWWMALPVLLLGTCAFLAVGLLVGAVSKTEESASAMANVVVLPMAFLSGTFFDISAAPAWLQTVSRMFPLRWMNDGMVDVLVRGQGAEAVWLPALVLLAFTIAVTAVATRVFRWEST